MLIDSSSTSLAIETQFGILDGRDAIYAETVEQLLMPHRLKLRGEINSRLCSNFSGVASWLSYELTFNGCAAFFCTELDIYNWHVVSSFDEVTNSNLLEQLKLPEHHHFLLSTYDHTYHIVAQDFVLEITGSRPR